MHIIVLAGRLSSSLGGMEISLLDVCHGLSLRGHSISLFYTEKGDQLERYQKFCDQITKIDTDKINIKIVTSSMINLLVNTMKIREPKSSVVYTNIYSVYSIGYALNLSKGIPLVCHLRLPAPDNLPLRWNNILKVAKRSVLLANVKKYIAVSNQVKLEWATNLKIQEEKIDVVYNGINPELFKPSENLLAIRKKWNVYKKTRIISYIGRLEETKGIDTLIRAFALLLKTVPNAQLFIAGKYWNSDGKYENYLEQLVTDLDLGERLNFLGHVSAPTSLYQVSDVTVLPSIWAEPFSRAVIESMACGTPVVGSRTGGTPEALSGEFQDMLFEPGDAQDLSNTLNHVIDWREENPQLGSKCREHILNNFSLDKTIDGVEQTLLETVQH